VVVGTNLFDFYVLYLYSAVVQSVSGGGRRVRLLVGSPVGK
jgi:hypothetical protein